MPADKMLFGGGRAGAAALACGAARAAPRPAVAGMGALRAGRLQGVGAGVGGAGASVGGAGAGVTGLGRSNGVWQQQTRHRGTGSMVQGAQLGIRVRNGNVEQAFFRQNRIMREEGLVMRFKSELRVRCQSHCWLNELSLWMMRCR